MRVTLLCAVMHCGAHLDAGRTLVVDDDVACDWLDRRLATKAAESARDPGPAPRDPIAAAQIAESASLATPAPDAGDDIAVAVASEPAIEAPRSARRRRP